MELEKFFPLARGNTLSIVGGGGKTSLMFSLASQLADQGNLVLVTTTTAMFHPDRDGWPYDLLVLGDDLFRCSPKTGQIVVAAKAHDPATQKLKGYSFEMLAEIREKNVFDYIFIEADGSRRLPVKAPADHEPVVPPWTDMVVGCIGLDCLGRPMDDQTVHRPELFSAITGLTFGEPIEEDHLVSLVASDQGLFKSAQKSMKKMVLLNKADTRGLVQRGQALAARISRECTRVDGCRVACLQNPSDPVIFGRTND